VSRKNQRIFLFFLCNCSGTTRLSSKFSIVFALKGLHILAQGKHPGKMRALHVVPARRRRRRAGKGEGLDGFVPRALPWANIENPFGVKNTPKNLVDKVLLHWEYYVNYSTPTNRRKWTCCAVSRAMIVFPSAEMAH
jgi:hypothetical protein